MESSGLFRRNLANHWTFYLLTTRIHFFPSTSLQPRHMKVCAKNMDKSKHRKPFDMSKQRGQELQATLLRMSCLLTSRLLGTSCITTPRSIVHHAYTIHAINEPHPLHAHAPAWGTSQLQAPLRSSPAQKKKHKAPLRHGCTHAFSAPPTKLEYIISTLGSSTFAFNN